MLLGDHNECKRMVLRLQSLGMSRPEIADKLGRAPSMLNCMIRRHNRFSNADEKVLEELLKKHEPPTQ